MPEGDREHEERPRIDLSPAIGEGGSEVEQLGFEGVPDTGPVLGTPDDADRAEEVDRIITSGHPPDVA
ncbi:MAG: hypothetical protein ACXVJ7_03585 [Acidimicrobiia bacterium]